MGRAVDETNLILYTLSTSTYMHNIDYVKNSFNEIKIAFEKL